MPVLASDCVSRLVSRAVLRTTCYIVTFYLTDFVHADYLDRYGTPSLSLLFCQIRGYVRSLILLCDSGFAYSRDLVVLLGSHTYGFPASYEPEFNVALTILSCVRTSESDVLGHVFNRFPPVVWETCLSSVREAWQLFRLPGEFFKPFQVLLSIAKPAIF